MNEKDELPPDVEIIDGETDEQQKEGQPSDVTIDLNAKDPVKKQDDPKPEPKQGSDEATRRLQNTIAYQTRQLERAMRELQQTKAEIQSMKQEQISREVPQSQDEIDELAQRDWKLGVKKVVEKDIDEKINSILEKRDQAVLEIQKKTQKETELETSKQKVIQRYPDINDGDSETASLYRQVLNEDTSLLSNVHGPEIAMYRMEEKMREMGKAPANVRPLIDHEVQRRARAGVSSVVGTRPPSNGKITLTREQKEFCDHYNIPYEQYAKNLKAQSFREGVEA